MRINVRFLAGGLVIAVAMAWLMYVGIRETSAFYLTVAEFLPQREVYAGQGLRLAGRVKPGTIEYDARTLALRFEVGDFKPGEAAGEAIPVVFTGIKPDMFTDGRDVIIEGKYSAGLVTADKVMTSCPSKYEAKLEPPAEGASAAKPSAGAS